jgi:hypothetical protein
VPIAHPDRPTAAQEGAQCLTMVLWSSTGPSGWSEVLECLLSGACGRLRLSLVLSSNKWPRCTRIPAHELRVWYGQPPVVATRGPGCVPSQVIWRRSDRVDRW